MANWLTDMKRQRMVNALKSPATQWQAMASNAPIGAVGAPSGLLAPPQPKPTNYLGGLLGAASMVPGIGDAAGIAADARMYLTDPKSRTKGNYAMSALGMLPFMPALATVFHGSPHKFDAFDMSKIGTGEGAQAYGHGLYFAEAPEVAKGYSSAVTTQRFGLGKIADKPMSELSPAEKGALIELKLAGGDVAKAIDGLKKRGPEYAQNVAERLPILEEIAAGNKSAELAKGSLYTVDLPDEAIAKMLDWDKPLSEQSAEIQDIFGGVLREMGVDPATATGKDAYRRMHEAAIYKGKPRPAAEKEAEMVRALNNVGIPGIRYLDGGSRSGGKGTSNYVVFDDKLPKILKRE